MGNLDLIENKDVEPMNMDYSPIPAGVYKAAIVSSEVVPTSKGDGLILKTTECLFDEKYGGREIRINFNIQNPNEKAQQIGRGMLSSLSRACGLLGIPNDSTELHEKYHMVKVVVQEGKGVNPATGEAYGPKNEIKAFYPLEKTMAKKAEPKPTVMASTPSIVDDDLPDFLK